MGRHEAKKHERERRLKDGFVMAGHSRSKNGVASLAYVPAIHAFVLADALRRGCHRNSGLPEFRKLNIAVSRVDPTYGDKRGHDGAHGSTSPENALSHDDEAGPIAEPAACGKRFIYCLRLTFRCPREPSTRKVAVSSLLAAAFVVQPT
jgi:hypothetical protein